MRDDEPDEQGPTWRLVAIGACSLVLTFGGLAAGVWSSALVERLDEIARSQAKQWEVLNQRASLAPRLDAEEQRTADQELRLRALEKQVWEHEQQPRRGR